MRLPKIRSPFRLSQSCTWMGTIGEVQRISFVLIILITYIFLTHHQIPALVTGHTTVDSVTTWAISHAIRDRQGPFVILVKVTSAEENEFVLYLARKFAGNGKPAWIGLYYHAPSRAYYWTDNSVPTYTNWAPKEPNGYSKEPCAAMYTGSSHLPTWATGYWNDILCTVKYNTVCKKLA